MNNKQVLKFGLVFLAIVTLFLLLSKGLPRKKVKKVGGCKGTEYGCCPDRRTACNRNCSNCFYN